MKRVLIMRGLPGSGKTSWIRDNALDDAKWLSADSYFIRDGRYQFDPLKIADAHNDCLRRFMVALQDDTESETPIVVDNTNLRLTEIAPYYRLAEAFGYAPTIVWVHAHPETCIARNIHGVPAQAIRQMAVSTEALLPWMNVEHV